LLVAYTDGLIERRQESLDVGFERLAAAIALDEPEMVCRRVMEALVGHNQPGGRHRPDRPPAHRRCRC
ncbi:MAG: SpoIIE family protein phosphatase, partial [Acidimicrobiia bacterium]